MNKISYYIQDNKWQLLRFAIVGIITFLFNFSLVWLFLDKISLDYRIAVSFAYLITVCIHFLLHRSFTYQQVGMDIGPHTLKYGAMLMINYLITFIIATVTVELFELSAYVGVILSALVTPFASFLLMNHFVFQRKQAF